MLRRQPTTLHITSEDISAYEDRRDREAQVAEQEARRLQRTQLHQAMAARAERPATGRRRTAGDALAAAHGHPPQRSHAAAAAAAPHPGMQVPSDPHQPLGVPGAGPVGGANLQERFEQVARARMQMGDARQPPRGTPWTEDVDDGSTPFRGDDVDMDSDSGPDDSMLEARQQLHARRAAAVAAADPGAGGAGDQRARERQETPPMGQRRGGRTREERIGGSGFGGGVRRR